jgi:chemotaxis protein MotA
MNLELEVHHAEAHEAFGAISSMGEGMPAFGIVAAVLGIIVTMGSITEPPEVLGGLIGAALVGTFLGILLAYGVVMPIAKNMELWAAADSKYIECFKIGILAHLQGSAPAVSVEFAHKSLFSHERPTFIELEDAMNA